MHGSETILRYSTNHNGPRQGRKHKSAITSPDMPWGRLLFLVTLTYNAKYNITFVLIDLNFALKRYICSQHMSCKCQEKDAGRDTSVDLDT